MPELKVGPAPDALVAVEVMGWKRLNWTLPVFIAPDGRSHYTGETIAERRKLGMKEHPGAFLPTTDITTAWLVVEKMRADGWNFSCEDEGRFGQTWTAWFNRNLNRDEHPHAWVDSGRGDAPTAPLAICLAALAACAAVLPSQQKGANT